jgi:hypothetical protein
LKFRDWNFCDVTFYMTVGKAALPAAWETIAATVAAAAFLNF